MPKKLTFNCSTGQQQEVDIVGAELTAYLDMVANAPPPQPAPLPLGGDDTPRDQLADAVTNLRGYLGLATPTTAQTVGALRLLIRVVLFILRRVAS